MRIDTTPGTVRLKLSADDGPLYLNVKPGTATFTAPTAPGTYPYHCIFHANMKGTLTVK